MLALNASSSDAGATLEFLDLYKRLDGGRLETTIRMLNGRWDGSAVVRDFGLREDPAMKRLTEESLAQAKAATTPHIDASNLNFTKLFVDFSKSGSQVEVKDGALYQPRNGGDRAGLDRFRRTTRSRWTAPSSRSTASTTSSRRCPLVGPILGGGANEGLFGLNYKITGSVAKPDLTIDPLSALAPGFLRKIFGAISEAAGNGTPAPTNPDRPIDPIAR